MKKVCILLTLASLGLGACSKKASTTPTTTSSTTSSTPVETRVQACTTPPNGPLPGNDYLEIMFNDTQTVGASAKFIDCSSTNTASWDYDFGDNTPHATVASPTHLYKKPGTYNVSLKVASQTGKYTSVDNSSIVKVGYRYLKTVTINSIDFRQSNGLYWDSAKGVDVYVTISNAKTKNILLTTDATLYGNVTSIPVNGLVWDLTQNPLTSNLLMLPSVDWVISVVRKFNGNPQDMLTFNTVNPVKDFGTQGNTSIGGNYKLTSTKDTKYSVTLTWTIK